jgi:hypothetical protein
MTVGTRPSADGGPVSGATTSTIEVDRSGAIPLSLAPGVCTVVDLRLISKGTPSWARPDLALTADDVRVAGRVMTVTVHSLGSVSAPAARVVVRDRQGRELATAAVPPLPAPTDLRPRTAAVRLTLPARADVSGARVSIEPPRGLKEITLLNNHVAMRQPRG